MTEKKTFPILKIKGDWLKGSIKLNEMELTTVTDIKLHMSADSHPTKVDITLFVEPDIEIPVDPILKLEEGKISFTIKTFLIPD